MIATNASPDNVECPRSKCIWHDEPESKGFCDADACPFTRRTRDRWAFLRMREESEIARLEHDLMGDPDGR